ncbi:zinc ribbon domain-containing protein [Paraburkholderia nemoris]|uniref:zinc ribbon domain-containing protein n=1 Tax=Paraburkholderia nemoris TaxID=2793076 RepID=UPI0038B7AD55
MELNELEACMGWLERMLGGHQGRRGGHDGGHRRSHGDGQGHNGGHGVPGQGFGHRDEQTWGRTSGSSLPGQGATVCPHCQSATTQGSRFCSQCAASLAPASCRKCNSTLAADAKFCGQCGSPAA